MLRLSMKRYVLVTLGLGLGLVGCLDGMRGRTSKPEPPVEQTDLANGLTVVMQHREQPTTAVLLTIHSGYASDPTGKEGLAHLVEHLVGAFGQDLGSGWVGAAQNLGAVHVNAYTTADETAYHAVVPSTRLPELLQIFHGLVSTPLAAVDEAVFTREQHIVKSERWLRDDQGMPAAVWAELGKMLFPETHPYSHSELGSAASVNGIGLQDVREFVGEHYRPNNISLAVVGPVSAAARVALQEFGDVADPTSRLAIGGLAPGNRHQPTTAHWAEQRLEGPKLKQLDGNDDARLWFAWALPPDPLHLDRFAQIIAHVGGDRLRYPYSEAHPGVTDVQLETIAGEQATLLLGSARLADGTSPEGALSWVNAEVLRAVLNKLQLRKDKLFYKIDPIDASLGMARASVQTSLDYPLTKAHALTHAAYHGLDGTQFLQDVEALGTEDPDTVRAYARTWITSARMRSVHVVKNARAGATQVEPSPGQAHSSQHVDVATKEVTATQLQQLASPPSASKLTSGTLPNGLTYALLDWPGARAPVVYLGHARGPADAPSPAIGRATQLALTRHTWLEVGPKGVNFQRYWYPDSSLVIARSGEQSVAQLAKLVLQRERDETPHWPEYSGATPELPRPMRAPYAESYARLLRDHPWSQVLGEFDLSKVTTAEVQDHWLDAFNPSRSILVAVGDFADPDAQHAILEEAANLNQPDGAFEASAQVISAPLMWTPIHELRFETETDLTQYAEFRCLLPSDAGLVINRLTTTAAERALFKSLRVERAIAYSVSSRSSTFRGDPFVMTIWADMPKHRVRDAFEVWEAFDSHPPNQVLGNELAAARIDAVRTATASELTPADAGYSLLSAWINGERFDHLESLPSAVAQVRDEAILDAFTFCREHSVLTFYGDRNELQKQWSDMLIQRALSVQPTQEAPAPAPSALETTVTTAPSASTNATAPAVSSAPPALLTAE